MLAPASLETAELQANKQASIYLHRPLSKDPGRIPSHHQGRTSDQPRSEAEKLIQADSRLDLSCFEPRGTDGASSENWISGEHA